MVTMIGQAKRSVHALILMVVGFAAPVYAGTLRFDFDGFEGWRSHRICLGIGPPGPSSIKIKDGIAKIEDGGCGMGSRTGIYYMKPWTDYEVKTRIQVKHLGPGGITLFVRAVRWCLGRIGEGPGPCPEDRPGGEFNFQGNSYRIWSGNPLDIGRWYDVRIVAEGDRVTYFINGQKVDEQAAGRTSGGVVFVTEMCEFWLDYVEITGVDILPVQPQGALVTCWAALKRSWR
jgi:hypothetical protein